MTKVLQLQFKTAMGKNYSVTVDEPIETLQDQQAFDAMQTIIDSQLFASENSPLTEAVGARIVDRQVTTLQA